MVSGLVAGVAVSQASTTASNALEGDGGKRKRKPSYKVVNLEASGVGRSGRNPWH